MLGRPCDAQISSAAMADDEVVDYYNDDDDDFWYYLEDDYPLAVRDPACSDLSAASRGAVPLGPGRWLVRTQMLTTDMMPGRAGRDLDTVTRSYRRREWHGRGRRL